MRPQKQGRNRRGQFAPGVSGNPGGRPKGPASITTALRELAGCIAPAARGAPDGESWAERVARVLLERAADGDLRAAAIVIDRIDGRAPVPVPSDEVVTIERIPAANVWDAATA